MRSLAVLSFAALCALPCDAVEFKFHRISSFDNTQIEASSVVPENITTPLPLVIFINSWGVPGEEYVWPSIEFAERGYITLEYAARGWFSSGGLIDTAGPNDVKDHHAIISWALDFWGDKVNASAIATGGISYGAGISLITAGEDERIGAAFAFSGWNSLADELWWNRAPSAYWLDQLESNAKTSGNAPDELFEMIANIRNDQNVNATLAWAHLRSPITYLPKLNARKVPTLLSQQFEDQLFHAHMQLAYWQLLEGPKKLFLNQGGHGEAAGAGAVPYIKDRIWNTCFAWMDRFLKGVQNDVEKGDLVQVSLSDHHDPLIPGNPVYTHANYSTWPPSKPEEKYTEVRYSLQSRSIKGAEVGELLPVQQSPANNKDEVRFSNATLMVVQASSLKLPVIQNTVDVNKLNATLDVVFLTAPFVSDTRICGAFKLEGLKATPNTGSSQYVGYLWSVKPKNFFGATKAAMLSHAPIDIWHGTANTEVTLPVFDFHAGCRDFTAGTSLMLGINLNGMPCYAPAKGDDASMAVTLNYESAVLTVSTVA